MQDVDRKSQVAREVESLLTKKLTTIVFLLDETSDGITFNMVAVVADAIEVLLNLLYNLFQCIYSWQIKLLPSLKMPITSLILKEFRG